MGDKKHSASERMKEGEELLTWEEIKANTWYKLENGKFTETNEQNG